MSRKIVPLLQGPSRRDADRFFGSTYQSEIVPASFRGLVVVSLQLFLNAGTLIATGVNKAYSLDTSATGWKVVTGLQFIFAIRMYPLYLEARDLRGKQYRSLNSHSHCCV